jgi:hypothetical protein
MTDLRTAAQQAESAVWLRVIDEALTVHHIGVADPADDYATAKRKMDSLLCVAQDIGAYFATDVTVAEPVAKVELMMTGGNAGLATRIVEIDDHLRERLHPGQILYTAPPARRPLTAQQLDKLIEAHVGSTELADGEYSSMVMFAASIERAHGIGE